MQEWQKISLLLCTFGFLKEIRPSEPFIVDYLAGPWRNVTLEEVVREAFPIGTYSYLAQLVIVFLVTDFLRYKPLIIVSGCAGIVVWSMLIWTTSLRSIQILEVFYGTYMATEVAYYTYIYAKVDREHYQKVTSHTRAAILGGKFLAGTISQILVYFKIMDYKELNYISLGAQISATIWALFLPSVATSLYFHRKSSTASLFNAGVEENNESLDNIRKRDDESSSRRKAMSAFALLWVHFKTAYTNLKVLQWSLWYALAMCGYYQITSYIQALWTAIDDKQEVIWNGAVEAILTLLGAIVSLLAGYLHSGFLKQRSSLFALMILSLSEGGVMLLATSTNTLLVSYLGYMIFGVLYAFTITVVSAEIAKNISDDSFGLIFGINTLVALTMQTILTLTVVDDSGFALDVIGQFTVYSYYYIVLGCIYLVFLTVDYFTNCCSRNVDVSL